MKKNRFAKYGMMLACLLASQVAFGQSLEEINQANASYESFGISLATVLYIFALILVIIAGGMLMIAVRMKRYLKGEMTEAYENRKPWWEKVFQIKSLSSDKDTVINHPHDGIYELDNPPPPWFMFLFYGTIVFALIYYVRFTFLDSGYTQAEEYVEQMRLAEEEHKEFLATAGDQIDETNVVLLTEEADLNKGKTIYTTNCVTCHGKHGEGIVGPNFTDKYWKFGGDIKDVFKTIKYGTTGGMQPWAQSMGPAGLQAVASYVISLEGTTVPAGVVGRPAEGDLYDRSAASEEGGDETEIEAQDSVETADTTLNE
ncbi:MAG: c-type cytochrome [Bacteroidia bacterium]|nr:c-type cytochrome [Bacteroidia bacterium]